MKRLIAMTVFLALTAVTYCIAANVKNYLSQPNAAGDNVLNIGGTQNVLSGGTLDVQSGSTLSVAGTETHTSMPTFSAGVNIDEDIDIDFDAADEEFNLTTSSGGITAAMTLYNSTTDLGADQHLLSLDFKDDGDDNGIFMRCRDNSAANTVLKIGINGAITIDVSGAGSGTVLSEATLVANDAAFRIDSEIQNLQIGDGTNDTVFSDDGKITQTGAATLTLQDGSDLIITANPSDGPFLSASSDDTTTGRLTANTFITSYGVSAATGVFSGAVSAAGITGTSFIIGLNTLDTNEWAFLDGLNQALKTTDYPTFAGQTLTYGVSAATGDFSGGIVAATLNTGQGANELYAMNQDVETTDYVGFVNLTLTYGVSGTTGNFSGAITGATVNTGQGDNELHAMNQDVETTDYVTFANADITYGIGCSTVNASGAITGATVNTGNGDNELYPMNQGVQTTDSVTFSTVAASAVNIIFAGQNIYELRFASSTVDGGTCTISGLPDSKAGWGQVQVAGTVCYAAFSWATDGTVTISTSTANVSATAGTDTFLNIYDSGDSIAINNELGSTLVIYGNLYYIE